jgi:Pyruvate/2-oxoacid:ferredoxin oxidoreductase delta subunit
VICRHCDHGHCYCPDDDCSELARIEAKRRYRADYQGTHAGRLMHAARQAEYRRRLARSIGDAELEKVTDHGSTPTDPSTTMRATTAISAEEEKSHAKPIATFLNCVRCDFCGRFCGPYVHRWLGRYL